MDLAGLTIFHTTGLTGSVSKAALKLNCVQSNVTTRIKQLESELDVALFYRKKRGMVLTPAGKTLMGYAEKARRLFREAEDAVRENGPLKGPLVVGSLESTAAVRLPGILSRFHNDHPDVELTIRTGTDTELRQMLDRHAVDAAFVEAFPQSRGFEQLTVFQEELVLVTGKGTPPPKDLSRPTFIVFPSGCTYRRILGDWFARKGVHAVKVMEFGSHEGILGCVAAGLGVTLFPVSLIQRLNYGDRIDTYSLPKRARALDIQFVTRQDAFISRAMAAFRDILFARAASAKDDND